MKLSDYLNVDLLKEHIDNGYVSRRMHNTLPLSIYTYTRKTIYSQTWDEVTRKTRGLIVADDCSISNLDGRIVARPFEKFFGYETPGISETYPRSVENIDKTYGPPIITEKINGCLGTMYKYEGYFGIATKGSFHSPHAEWANNWLRKHFDYAIFRVGGLPADFTPMFEIICQEVQPHPIKYEKDELVLLAMIHNETGQELNYDALKEYGAKNNLRVTNRYGFSLDDALTLDSTEMEGLVATWPIPNQSPFKLKIKFKSFLENRKKFYEALKARDEAQEKAKKQPEYEKIFDKAAGIVMIALAQCTERHEFIAYFNRPENKKYRSICVAMLDHNDETRRKLIWKMVKDGGENV